MPLRSVSPGGYRPHRGDIVVFDDTHTGWLPVPGGRPRSGLVLATPGDHVTCAGSGQPIQIDHVPPAAGVIGYATPPTAPAAFEITVPAGHLWIQAAIGFPDDDSSRHLTGPGGPHHPRRDRHRLSRPLT
ncbi:hypothetical protein [Nocardia terpenica]|uniref:Uncharacterized protein n=1 Tax=Nocardia terpenica TaxID=455432 RepID=A0A6G9Z717_9NOCA|nr:hypothetical protein [Nocardia terpenica]QIS21147.1 hypothetical protein F6W96_25310 [Nocardia terpenica]